MHQVQQQEMVQDGMDEVGSERESKICSLIFVTAQCEH